MNREKSIAAVQLALEVMKEASIDPESTLGAAAFPAILSALLSDTTPEAKGGGRRSGAAVDAPGGNHRSAGDTPATALDRAATWLGVEPDRLADLVEFSDDSLLVHLAPNRLPSSRAKKQRVLALVYLGLARNGLQQEEVDSGSLNAILDEYGAVDQNVWKNLQAGGSFGRRGHRGSYRYRLTLPGLTEARDRIKGLLGAD